jgi:transposase
VPNDTYLSNEQWKIIKPELPPQPTRGRRRKQDRAVLNSLVWRLKTGARYQDLPKHKRYAKRSTTYHWLQRWAHDGTLERIWQTLLGLLELEGKLDLSEGYLDGSFVPAKKGGMTSPMGTKAKAQP